jgi:hypothetical protein
MGEVAMQLFQQPPNAFVAELRKGRYAKVTSSSPDVLDAVVQLGLPVETSAHAGVMLLPPATVEALLQDKRRLDLLQPLKMAMLKLASQVGAVGGGGGLRGGVGQCRVCAVLLMSTARASERNSQRHDTRGLALGCHTPRPTGGSAADGGWRLRGSAARGTRRSGPRREAV